MRDTRADNVDDLKTANKGRRNHTLMASLPRHIDAALQAKKKKPKPSIDRIKMNSFSYICAENWISLTYYSNINFKVSLSIDHNHQNYKK